MNNKNKEKIVFTLPEGILSEVDKIIQMENILQRLRFNFI